MLYSLSFLLLLGQVALIRSFLVNGTSSTKIPSYEFQLISKLILDEQTRTSRLEGETKDLLKDYQVIKTSRDALETHLNTTKSGLVATRHELAATKYELSATRTELNATKRELDGQMATLRSMKAKLDKAITNRLHQLETAYTAVTSDIHNLSRPMGKPTMWFSTRSDINRPIQSQKRARILKFSI